MLLVSPADLATRLASTVLWRSEIDRVHAQDAQIALGLARELQPKMVLVDASAVAGATSLLRRLRDDDKTRAISRAAIAGDGFQSGERALRKAGADLVLTPKLPPSELSRRLEGLLDVPRRRETRLPASLQLWCRSEPAGPLREALVLNLSVRGMLIQTNEALPLGTTVEIRLPLPAGWRGPAPRDRTRSADGPDGGEEDLALMGLVERQVEAPDGRYRSGVQFLILRDRVRDRLQAFIEAEARE